MGRIIRNPSLHWPRLDRLIEQIAKARKNHKPTSELEREARYIRTAIIGCEVRHATP